MSKLTKRINELKEDDLTMLNYLYLYRAMDVDQLMTYVYNIDVTTPSGKRKRTIITKRLKEQDVIVEKQYKGNQLAWQITNKGIEIVRHTKELPTQIYNKESKTVERGYYTAAELDLNPRLINHQVHLNQLMIDFQSRLEKIVIKKDDKIIPIPWTYYDEKFLSQYVYMRPDGMIQLLGYDLFIETDMATESYQQLKEKFEGYKNFAHTSEFINRTRKILILFQCDNIKQEHKIKNRVELVKKAIKESGLLQYLTEDFDIVVDSRKGVVDYIFDHLIPRTLNKSKIDNSMIDYLKSQGYLVSYGSAFRQLFNGDYHQYYVRKLTDNKKLEVIDNEVNEFFLDIYTGKELSILHRLDFYNGNKNIFKEKYGRHIKYIVVITSLQEYIEEIDILERKLYGEDDVYYLELNNLDKEQPLYMNLYQLGDNSQLFKVIKANFKGKKYITTLNEKELFIKQGDI